MADLDLNNYIIPVLLNPPQQTSEQASSSFASTPVKTPEVSDIAASILNNPPPTSLTPEAQDVVSLEDSKRTIAVPSSFSKTTQITQNITPFNEFSSATDKNRFFQQSVGGADLSVFYVSEMPVFDDVIAYPDMPEIWRKEAVVIEMGNVLSLSYQTLRERYPVRVIGKANPVAFTNGIRTIAGHLAFAVFARDVLQELRSQVSNKFKQYFDSITSLRAANSSATESQSEFLLKQEAILKKKQMAYNAALDFDRIQLLDSLPPFNLLVMGVNEQGTFSRFLIRGVRIIDENQLQGTTQPNIVNKVSWVAVDIVPMNTFDLKKEPVITSVGSITENYSSSGYSQTIENNIASGTNLLLQVREGLSPDAGARL